MHAAQTPLASATRLLANLRHLTAMNTKDLIKSYSITSGIPIGHKEALAFFVIADYGKPMPSKEIECFIGGKPTAARGLLARLMKKDLVSFDVTKSDGRVYSLTRKGKSILAKTLK